MDNRSLAGRHDVRRRGGRILRAGLVVAWAGAWWCPGVAPAQEPGETAASEARQVTLPEIVYAAPPVYPEQARADGIETVVRLEVDVDATGRVLDARPLDDPDPAFAASAVQALRASRFAPATVDGEPVAVTITYGLAFTLDVAPRLSVTGTVRQAGTREPLQGVTLELAGPDGALALAVSGEDGSFAVYDLAAGAWDLTAVGPGLRAETVPLTITEDDAVEVSLFVVSDRPWEAEADEIVDVVAAPRASEVSTRRLDTQAAMALPGTNGDILKAVLNFPGVARPPLQIGQLIVRGTPADATRYYIDGVRVPLVFHFGGLSTVLNGDALEQIRFSPGNFSVRYGDGLGGAVDLTTRTSVPERSRGYVTVDVYQAGAFVEQKVGERTWITASARRSYADAVLGPILSGFGGGREFRAPRYYDGSLRVTHRTKGGGVLDAAVVGSDDQFRLLGGESGGVRFGLATTFVNATVGWRDRLPGEGGWRTETRLVVGPERNAFFFDDTESSEEAVQIGLRQELRRDLADPDAPSEVGGRVGLDLDARAFRFSLGGFGGVPLEEGETWRLRPAVYGEGTFRAGPVTWVVGLRGSVLSLPGTTWTYALDPRLTVVGQVTPTTELTATVGRYSQYPEVRELLPDSRGNPDLRPNQALQVSVGLSQQLPLGLSLELTGYHNSLSDLVVGRQDRFEFTAGPPVPRPEDIAAYSNEGRGRTFGVELLLRLQRERAAAWLSATVGRSTRVAREGADRTVFAFDQTLVLNALATYQLPKRWTVGGRLRVGTGNPYIPVVNRVFDVRSRAFLPVYGDTTERLRAFWAVDLRVDKQWTFDRWALTLYLDVQGITDPNNPELIGYTYDFAEEDPIRSVPPLPAFGLKGAW